MADPRSIGEDLALAYSQKLWDAGNLIVTMMFALAFGVYYTFVQVCESRIYAAKYWLFLVILSILGNILLGWLIHRLYKHEIEVIRAVEHGRLLFHALWAARNIRWGVLAFNTLLYIGVIIFISAHPPAICPSPAKAAAKDRPALAYFG